MYLRNLGEKLCHKKMQYNYSKKMFTRRAKPIRIIGDLDSHRPNKWSYNVVLFCCVLLSGPLTQWYIVKNIVFISYTYTYIYRRCGPTRAMASSFLTRFLDHTQRRTTVGRTPLDEWSARRRELYLTTHNIHNRHPCPRWDSNSHSQQASGRRPVLDRTATVTGRYYSTWYK